MSTGDSVTLVGQVKVHAHITLASLLKEKKDFLTE
jgi:hypothetical protein